MTEFLNELSENQINYLKQQKKHKYIVGISRILILFSFLFLWEFTANVGIIDSFIFVTRQRLHYVSGAWCWIKAFFCTPMSHYTRQS